jgi:hypothetical protein
MLYPDEIGNGELYHHQNNGEVEADIRCSTHKLFDLGMSLKDKLTSQ